MKPKTLKNILLVLPALALAAIFFAFQPGFKAAKVIENSEEFSTDPNLQLYFTQKDLYEDNTKMLIHLVWIHDSSSPYIKYTIEKSVNNQEFAPLATEGTDNLNRKDIMALPELRTTGVPDPYHRIMYSTEDNGGFIYNEVYDKDGFSLLNIKYRLKAEHNNGSIAYSKTVGFPINKPARTRNTGLRAPCPSVGSAPKGYSAVSGSSVTGIACDCGTYDTQDYVEPCPSPVVCTCGGCNGDCDGNCGCTVDPCCEHKCGQFASCNCVKSKWTSCANLTTVTVVTKVNTACTAPSGTTKVTNTCACTGAVDLTVTTGSCGNTSYSYSWSSKSSTQDLNNVCPGTYTVTITDGCGKTATAKGTVASTGTAPTLSNTFVDASCVCDGSVNLTVTGGTAAFSYSWSNKATSQDLSGLCAGTYTVTVTDACAMTATSKAVVGTTAGPAPTLSNTVVNASCVCDGSVNLTVTGGTKAFSYSWSNKATTEDLSALCAGTYTVTVTDACSMTATNKATITSSANPAPTLSSTVVNTTCGLCDGDVDLTVSGGNPGFTYSWSNKATSQDLSNVCSGTYTVTVTDACALTATAKATIAASTAPAASITATNATCGASTGLLDLTPSGGAGGYTYSWSNKATSQDISGLGAGTYTVTVTDASGCTVSASQATTNCTGPSCSTTITDLGNGTGNINLTPTAGTCSGTFTYSWSNKATTQDLSGVPGGITYIVTVTDGSGCTVTCDPYLTNILPIEIIKFTAVRKDRTVLLSWATASEVNNDYFTVERSQYGNNYFKIGEVDAAGSITQQKNYDFTDNEPYEGISYYRLKQTDFNGKFTYSNVVMVSVPPKDIFNVHPTLVQGKIELTLYGENEDLEIIIMDVSGRQLTNKTFEKVKGINKYYEDVSGFANGTYYVSMKNSTGVTVKRFVKY